MPPLANPKHEALMRVELWGIARPKPYEGNPRKLPEKAIKKVAASIKEFGFRSPIVVDEQEIILAGHTRLEAAKSLGLKTIARQARPSMSRFPVPAPRSWRQSS